MLILGKLNLNEKVDIQELTLLLKTFSSLYVKRMFKKSREFKNKQKVARLLNLQQYIQSTYNIKQDILHILLYILHAIKINNNGILYINKEKVYTIKVDEIYKLISFGNLEVQKSAIFYEAINFGIKQIKMMKVMG